MDMTTPSLDPSAANASPEASPPASDFADRLVQAERIIHRNVLWALGAGVVPVPIFDVLAVTSVQAKMLRELSRLYKVDFKDGLAKKLVVSLLSAIGGVGIGAMIGASLFKLIPPVGIALGVVAVPVTSGAFTHAVGRVFVMHFEAGGTFIDFDPARMREHFRKEFEAAKEKVRYLQKDGPSASAPQNP